MGRYAINGFGRIGRSVLRSMSQSDLENIVAINDITDNKTLSHLLKYDSVGGKYKGEISYDDENITVNGHKIRIFEERDPANLPWAELKVDVVVESTGLFTKRDSASKHLAAGAKKVIISAPATDPDITVCLGINMDKYDASKHHIISNASCTTNCLAPMVKILNDKWGVKKGLMTTVHSYTNDQRILDLPHSDLRRSRAAAVNIIPTSTGAAKAIGLVIPELAGKLNGYSLRVPTPTGSVTDLVAELNTKASLEDIKAEYKKAAEGNLKGIMAYSEDPLVLQDIVGDPHSCIIDSDFIMELEGNMVKIVGWYDNEAGYSNRTCDLLKLVGENL